MELSEINNQVKNCRKCRLHETRKHSLPGEGNDNARLFLIAQAPGKVENDKGKMFVGPSGKIFHQLTSCAGVSWNDFYVSNLIKCQLPKSRKPKQDEIDICSKYLDKEIEIITPEIFVPLGYYATIYIFRKYHLPEFSKKDFPNHIGRLRRINGRKIFPLSHPATLLYDPHREEKLKSDYNKLKILKKECKWYSACPIKYFTEKGLLDKKWVDMYCRGDWENCVRYKMEESGEYHSDYMLPDGVCFSFQTDS